MVGTECDCVSVCEQKPVCKRFLSLGVNPLCSSPACYGGSFSSFCTVHPAKLFFPSGMSPIVKSPECSPLLCHCKVACTNNTLSLMFGCKVSCRLLSLFQRNFLILKVSYFEWQ